MFKKVLFPTDFSEVSEKALRYIKELTKSGLKEVVVLHVVDIRILEASHGYLSGKDIEDYQSGKIDNNFHIPNLCLIGLPVPPECSNTEKTDRLRIQTFIPESKQRSRQ